MDNSIHIPLDLPDVRVLEVSKTEQEHWLICLESTLNGTTCHRCGQQITHFHFQAKISGRSGTAGSGLAIAAESLPLLWKGNNLIRDT